MSQCELSGVGKAFDRGPLVINALQGVDLSIEPGEFVALEGPSGSGKTTLLQLLGALDRPSSGQRLLRGRDLAELRDGDLAELRLRSFGFVFQQFNLIPTLTALENIEAKLAPDRRAPASGSRQRAEALLAEVGLADRATHLPSHLSGGEQQRVAIARALSVEPHVILADEPTGNLDTSTGTEIVEMLASLAADRGTTVIVATHDIGLAGRAQRRLAMRDGRFARDGGRTHRRACRRRSRQLLETSSRALRKLLGRAVPLGSVNPTPKEQRDEEHQEASSQASRPQSQPWSAAARQSPPTGCRRRRRATQSSRMPPSSSASIPRSSTPH